MQQLSFEPNSSSIDRLPPQNIEAEEAILGGILLDPEALGRIADLLTPDTFYVTAHKDIYQAALRLSQSGRPTDLLSVTSWLTDNDLLARIGGRNKLATLVDRTVSAINIDGLALLVADKHLRRKLIKAGNEIVCLGYETETELPEVLDKAQEKVFNIKLDATRVGLTHISELLVQNFEGIEERNLGTAAPSLHCGFYDLDSITGGFTRGDLIIIAARPSMGKTGLVLNLAHNIADSIKLPVGIFSLEMSKEQLSLRLLSTESKIESGYLRGGKLSLNQWQPLSRAIDILSQMPIYIDDTANITVTQIRSQARRLQAEQGTELGLIVIDYLQLMEGQSNNRVQELSKITRQLKALARELSVPVIALSQLSRAVESRTNKRPMLSDLRESGCLTGDTLISLGTGEQVTIQSLQGKSDFVVWGLNDEKVKFEFGVVSNVFSTGVKPIFTIKLKSHRSIKATANHPFYGLNGWCQVKDLRISDLILTPSYFAEHPFDRLYWDEIENIVGNGMAEVFDMTVPGLSSFVANNIVVHNSIEQDADLVMMIYRDEYYNPDSPDRGIAELIVAKHRNGPTGTVKLLFDPNFVQFKNLLTT